MFIVNNVIIFVCIDFFFFLFIYSFFFMEILSTYILHDVSELQLFMFKNQCSPVYSATGVTSYINII